MINQRSLGGCPPRTDETGTSKLRQGALVCDIVFDNGTLTTIDDNSILEDVNCIPELETSEDHPIDFPELADMPDHYVADHCFTIDLIATEDNSYPYFGCAMATKRDEFDMFMVNVMQRIVSEEEYDRTIVMEKVVDEDVENAHIKEEEMQDSPP